MTTFPEFETFRDLVIEDTKELLSVYNTKDVDEYLQGEEAQEEIRTRYESYLNKFNEGRLAKVDLKKGCVSSVSNCLYYMF